jgi:hypothetical protein
MIAKSLAIKDRGAKSGGRAAKGGRSYLGRSALCPGNGTEVVARRPDRNAEVSRGHSRRSDPAEGPNGWKWGVETRISTAPCGRQAVLSVLLAKAEGEARPRGHAGTEALSWMHVSKPRRPPLLREQVSAQSAEPPYTDPYVRWFGRGGVARLPPIPIARRPAARNMASSHVCRSECLGPIDVFEVKLRL